MKKDECYRIVNPETGETVGADPNIILEAYSHSAKEGEEKIYFKIKASRVLRKFLESLSKVPRELHHCGCINCDLSLRGWIYPENNGKKFKYREYQFALIKIIEDGKLVLETDYKRFSEYLKRNQAHNKREIVH